MALGSVATAHITPLLRFGALARLSPATPRLLRLNVEIAALAAVRMSMKCGYHLLSSYEQVFGARERSGPYLHSPGTFCRICALSDHRLDNS